MAEALFIGAGLGAVMQLLLTEVQSTIVMALAFKEKLQNIEKKLKRLNPLIQKMEETNKQLDLSLENTTNFVVEMKKGTELVAMCKSFSNWKNVCKRPGHTKKLRELDKSLGELSNILFLQLGVDNLTISGDIQANMEKFHKENTAVPAPRMVGGRCAVPQPPQHVVGLDKPLAELKMKLLHKDTSVLVLTAPPGYGKTTLAQKLCKDREIEGKFRDNIMFIKVSKTADLNHIVHSLYQHKGYAELPDIGDASASLEQLLREMGPGPILLVLDDVWNEFKDIIEKFKFDIPEYKILVTSRVEFPAFGPTYKLKTLDYEDATSLLRFYAKLEDQNSNIPDELVKEVVKCCKRVPLALKLIGSSLCGRHREIWRSELKEWSKWNSSVLDFEDELLRCLKSSLDVFGQKDDVLKKCFLDLGSFPEDMMIPATALVDMWTVLHRLEDEDATAYLFKLSGSNMANVVVTRKDADEDDDYYSEHFITQHDMLRELAIYQSRRDPEAQRKRLILEFTEKSLPDWWNEPNKQTFNAHLVSITTDGKFSSKWCNLNLPEAEVLILNFQSENYVLPDFLKTMSKLKVLVITNYGFFPAKLSNFELLGSLTNLKRIRFERVVIPPLSETSIKLLALEKLSLFLCNVGQAFGSIQISEPFPNLKELNIDYCGDFAEIPVRFCDMVKNVLRKLSITHCHKLSTLPVEIGEMKNLEVLRLRSCIGLDRLPDSMCGLSNLKFLDISDCFGLRNLPEDIGNLSSLTKLNMKGCY